VAILHSIRPEAWAAALDLLARHQGYDRLAHADEHGGSFDLDEVLDAWSPGWRGAKPPAGMGARSRQLTALTYCVFTGVWEAGTGFLLHHPDQLLAHSVTVSFLLKDDDPDTRRALLTVSGPRERVYVPFPTIPPVLLASPGTYRFAESHAALDALANTMIERVNLLAPAALLLDRGSW
jgi:hypothetical protein